MSPTASMLPSHVMIETDWKFQRKLKHHQRDVGRRTAKGRAEPRCRHNLQHQHRAHVMRTERNAWLPTPAKSPRCRIPKKLRQANVWQLSRSDRFATSWPPAKTVIEELEEVMGGMSTILLASSAPLPPFAERSDVYRREVRPLTLIESARIFNESGQLLSHGNLDEMRSSPEMIGEGKPKRKIKRRVGRHKLENKRVNVVDALNADEVVLELMCLLLPDVEVTQELNLLLLGGAQHDHVFPFDEDDIIGNVPADTKLKKSVLDIDMLNFQAALATMLFDSDMSIQELPAHGTSIETLQEMYLTPQWIAHEVLTMVKLDVVAQYNRFAVINAIFRTIPKLRFCLMKATASVALAIFQHQGLVEIVPRTSGKSLVTIKGLLEFLKAAMDVIERDARYNAEVFGSSDAQICDAITQLCGHIMRAIQLLVRSYPGGIGASNSNRNQLEKYAECSDSAQATTFRDMGELVNRMATFSPMHGENFLRWMLLKWPHRNVQLQLLFVRYTAGLLSLFMQLGLMFPVDVVRHVFTRIQVCIQSAYFLVAKEALNMCMNFQLMTIHLSCDQALREKIASALHENATSHWNKHIREISDECFDMLLDLV
ncbi:unnamed protein product [Peronospora belbahrii]|uniref:Uncharacterized protein n=1 Tax=Peronospora belbahrii TaxID=622444 RepID=A0AAU9LKG6_9STRA|nr:unnamed protein product [Peronospora belbahrii]CAH0522681.1 unnamed protein product [Peronospora belbahrii]